MWVCFEEGRPGPGARGARSVRCSPPHEALDDAREWTSGEPLPPGYARRRAYGCLDESTGLKAIDPRPEAAEARIRATRRYWETEASGRTPERGDILHEAERTIEPDARAAGIWIARLLYGRHNQLTRTTMGQLVLATPHETGRKLTAARWPGRWTGSTEKRIRTTPTRPTAADVVALLRWRERWGAWPTTLQLVQDLDIQN